MLSLSEYTDCLRISAFKREWLLPLFHTKYPTLQSPYIHIYNFISEVWRSWFLKEKSLEQWFRGTGASLCYYIFLSSSYDYPTGKERGCSVRWLILFHFSLSCIGEGNGNPLQCSCLENPRDGGAWWAAVYGVRVRHDWSDLAAKSLTLVGQPWRAGLWLDEEVKWSLLVVSDSLWPHGL